MLKDALALHESGQLDQAATLYRAMLADNPRNADALHLLGVIALQRKDAAIAVDLISRAVEIDTRNAAFFSNLGLALMELGRFQDALAAFTRALAIKPDYADALNHRGNALRALKRFDEALASYARTLAINPGHADALNNRGAALSDLRRFEQALANYDRALAIRPLYPEALTNRGVALGEMNRFDEAIASHDRALSLAPDYAQAWNNRGNALSASNRFDEAVASYDRALAIKPNYVEALYNRGTALHELNRFGDALRSFESALAIRSDYAQALNGRGVVLLALNRFDAALASFRAALAIEPDDIEALFNCGNVLGRLKRFDEALACYERALAIKPDYEFLFGATLFCKMRICDWRGLAADFDRVSEAILAGKKAAMPSEILATPLSAARQKQCARIFAGEKHPRVSVLPKIERHSERSRIRLGYFSADFHSHATAHLLAELFERHDRARFDVTAFSFGPAQQDAIRQRLQKSFDRFVDVAGLSDMDVALLARESGIDLAIDLKGFTQDSRPGIFAAGVAPIQASYLGYPGTMGADYIDYLIADPILIPQDQRRHYFEKIVYLPHSYQANDSKRPIADRSFTRAECGLPENAFVFCCFNSNYKIAPAMFDIWMRILRSVEGSVLWLFEENAFATKNLRREAHARGVAPERLVFAPRMELPEHLARHRLADLFLDTLPYNAHTTASDALWAGLPVLTCLGENFPGRVGASLLNALGLPELITHNLGDYAAQALALADGPSRLQALRRKLAANRSSFPLFDSALFARHIEAAYRAMWQRHREGLAPDHIQVPP
ncbi:MAG TPA: tetratricopeptide repeat protein [Micropepsaceae bacterium]|nr:tetratricopeptide repeat protein [Micropepsaceae bacterium]